MLAPGFRNDRQTRCFPNGFTSDALHYQPEVLAGSIQTLRDIAHSVQRGGVSLRSLEYAVVVLTELHRGLLSPEDRRLLWDAFGVPVFEQIMGPRMETLATECEAHCGLHLSTSCSQIEDLEAALSATVIETPCACGQPGTRLVAAVSEPQPLRAFAQTGGRAA